MIERKASIKATLRPSTRNKKGEQALVIRVYYPGYNNKNYSTGIFYDPKDWTGYDPKAEEYVKRATDIINRIRLLGMEFNWEIFESQFLEKSGNASVIKYIETTIPLLNTEGTKTSYKDLRARLLAFSGRDISFGEVSPIMISRFMKFLEKTNNKNSVNIYLRTFMALYNKAAANGMVQNNYNPFKGIKMASVRSRNKRYLTIDELKKINESKLIVKNNATSMWVDSKNYFMASYLACGMNAKDLFQLKWKDLKNGEIHTDRLKTGNPLHITINPDLNKIFNHYKTKESSQEDFVFPVNQDYDNSDKKTSEVRHNNILSVIVKNIRKIAVQENIETSKLDFYTARHTFAVHYLQHEKSPSIYNLMRYMGHSSEKSTRSYIESLIGTGEVAPITFYDSIL